MTVPRIYSTVISEPGDLLELGGKDLHYIKNVLRLRPKDSLIVFDGRGNDYETAIESFAPDSICLRIIKKTAVHEEPIRITLAQSLPKEAKMDFIIQKATELGVWQIIPFLSSRTVPRLTDSKAAARAVRWRKIAVEAAKQSRRTIVPEISEILHFETMLEQAATESLKLILWEDETRLGIKEVLRAGAGEQASSFYVIIGPEGGFSLQEVEKAREFGFLPISLGQHILRLETASLAILAILQYEKGLIRTPVRSGAV